MTKKIAIAVIAFLAVVGLGYALESGSRGSNIGQNILHGNFIFSMKDIAVSGFSAGEIVTEKNANKIISKLASEGNIGIQPESAKLEKIYKKNGILGASFSQKYNGVPVLGSRAAVFFEGNKIKLGKSNFFESIPISTKPKISESDVAKIIKSGENLKPELMILPIAENGGAKFRLAYKADTPLDSNMNAYSYFIDANSGEIIKKFDRRIFETGPNSVVGKIYPESPAKGSIAAGIPFQYVRAESGVNNVFFSPSDTYSYLETNDLLLSGTDAANFTFLIKGDMEPSDVVVITQYFLDETEPKIFVLSLSDSVFNKIEIDLVLQDSYIVLEYIPGGGRVKRGIFLDEISAGANYTDGSSEVIFSDSADNGFLDFFDSGGFEISEQPAGTGIFLTDENGFYSDFPAGNNVSSALSGPLVHVYNFGKNNSEYFSESDLSWNWETEDDSYLNEETNVFYHLNYAKAFFYLLGEDLTKTTSNVQVPNISCNAFALPDPLQSSIYFAGAGGGCEATSLGSDIIYHEYSHLAFNDIFDNFRVFFREAGSMDEGVADYFAASLTGEPAMAEDIFPSDDVRYLNNSLTYPDDFAGGIACEPDDTNDYCFSHDNSRIISGALWGMREEVGASVSDELIYGGLKVFGPLNFSDFLGSIVSYDDAVYDGLHIDSVCSAFGEHGITSDACPTPPTTTTTSTSTTATSSTTTTVPPVTTIPPTTSTTTTSSTTTTLPPATTSTTFPTTTSTTTTSTTTTTLPPTTTTVPPTTTTTSSTTTTTSSTTTTSTTTTTLPPTTTTTSSTTTTTLPPTTTTTSSTTTTVPPTTVTTVPSTTTTTIPPAISETVSFPSWLKTDFLNRKKIEISNSGGALENYQVPLSISFSEKMQPDFSDIRFTWNNTTTNSETEIPYWIESLKDGESAYVWVNVPEISSDGENIYVYYGNRSPVLSESNGYNTFPFFDDFENSNSLDLNKWFIRTGNWIVQNGNLILNKDAGNGIIATKQKMENYAARISAKYNGSASIATTSIGIRYDNTTTVENSYGSAFSIANSENTQCDFGFVQLVGNGTLMGATDFKEYCYSNSTYHTFEFGASGDKMKFSADGENKIQFYDSALKDGYTYIFSQYSLDAAGSPARFSVDWALQRSFSDTEPAALFGKEESMPEPEIKISDISMKMGLKSGAGGEIKFSDKTKDVPAFLVSSTRTKGIKAYDIEISEALKSEFLWATLKFNYSEINLGNVNEDSLAVYFFNETLNLWVKEESIRNKTGKYVEANVSHLSTFALAGNENIITTTTSPPGGGGGGTTWGYIAPRNETDISNATTTTTTFPETTTTETSPELTTTTTSEAEKDSEPEEKKEVESGGPTGLFELIESQPTLMSIVVLALAGAIFFFGKLKAKSFSRLWK